MRIIYINIGGSLKVSSIYKKIQGQVNAFINNGVDCKGYFLITEVKHIQPYSENIDLVPVKKAERKYFPQLQQKVYFLEAMESLLAREKFDYVYLRYPSSHHKLLSIVKRYPKKVIIEINSNGIPELRSHFKNASNNRFISAFLSKLQDLYIPVFYEKLLVSKIVNHARLIVAVTPEILEVYKTSKTAGICISNGIDVSKYPTRIAPTYDSSKIIMLILDGTNTSSPWQGMDRLIKSIQTHQLTNVIEVWLCGNKNEYPHLNFIKELGYLQGDELTRIFNQVNFGSGNFAPYRLGIKDISALKSREYMARGLPLVYAGNDEDIESTGLKKYAYKIPNDDSIIDLPSIITWITQLYENHPKHPTEMKELAHKTLSFDIKVKQLLTFLKK